MSLLELPFVSFNADGSVKSYWSVNPDTDYTHACLIGRLYAVSFCQYLVNNPSAVDEGTLQHIIGDIDFKRDDNTKGYWIVFLSHIELLLYNQAQRTDLWADFNQRNKLDAHNITNDRDGIQDDVYVYSGDLPVLEKA